jgi:hypothetical protein
MAFDARWKWPGLTICYSLPWLINMVHSSFFYTLQVLSFKFKVLSLGVGVLGCHYSLTAFQFINGLKKVYSYIGFMEYIPPSFFLSSSLSFLPLFLSFVFSLV